MKTGNYGGLGQISFARPAGEVMDELADVGYVYVSSMVGPAVIRALGSWTDGQRFSRHDENTSSGVIQRLEVVESPNLRIVGSGKFFIAGVERWVQSARNRWPTLGDWRASDVALQRYGGRDGISPHLDYKRQHGPIIVVTLAGEADFMLHETRDQPPTQTYRTRPGDAILLRGDLGFKKSTRPLHSVSQALGPERRISLGLRHDKRTNAG